MFGSPPALPFQANAWLARGSAGPRRTKPFALWDRATAPAPTRSPLIARFIAIFGRQWNAGPITCVASF